jgi:hypothetical protein
VDKGYHNGNCPMPKQHHHHIVPILRQEEAKKDSTHIGSSISVQQLTIPIHVPRRNLKTTGRWHKKVELTKRLSVQEIPNTRLQKLSSKPFAP